MDENRIVFSNNSFVSFTPMNRMKVFAFFPLILLILYSTTLSKTLTTDILIIQAGTGGTSAAISAARMGAKVILTEPYSWLGGMLTSAGVSGTDGNDQLPSGIWGEFRDSLVRRYGSKAALSTGWVSNTLFEPHIGNEIFKNMTASLPSLNILYHTEWKNIRKVKNNWIATCIQNGKTIKIKAKILIDGTDMGDVAAHVGVKYDLGMDDKTVTGEPIALDSPVNIIQDFTYAAILKEYQDGKAPVITRPADYDRSKYHCACDTFDCRLKTHPCKTMLSYAQLPNNKYMINWPIYGNDYYFNLVENNAAERQKVLQQAKNHTMGFLYFIQQELGYKNLGIADDEYPTPDGLPFMPYYREGRRIKGLVQINMNHAERPFDQPNALFRTGIAVGDYPIDHHHGKNAKVPKLEYVPIPSFNVPTGSLIPKEVDNLIMADKAISVTNIMNGATRLQPVILQIGQAAGTLAAISIEKNIKPSQVNIRLLQSSLLKNKVYLMPYLDVDKYDPAFESIQRIGATGILRGKGMPFKWANQTWFYPDSTVSRKTFQSGIRSWQPNFRLWNEDDEESVSQTDLTKTILELGRLNNIILSGMTKPDGNSDHAVSRKEISMAIDKYIDAFNIKKVDFNGNVK